MIVCSWIIGGLSHSMKGTPLFKERRHDHSTGRLLRWEQKSS